MGSLLASISEIAHSAKDVGLLPMEFGTKFRHIGSSAAEYRSSNLPDAGSSPKTLTFGVAKGLSPPREYFGMLAHLFGSVRDLRTSASQSTADRDASGDRPQPDDPEPCSTVRSRADTDDALPRARCPTLGLLNLLKYAETEAVEQELQTTAVLLGAAIADLTLQLEQGGS
jgi:hypothetical protein